MQIALNAKRKSAEENGNRRRRGEKNDRYFTGKLEYDSLIKIVRAVGRAD